MFAKLFSGQMEPCLRNVALACLLTACGAILPAQTRQTGIEILVVDRQGGPIADVRVVIEAGNTVFRDNVTDAEGHIRFLPLAPGTYTVRATKEGFHTVEKSDVDFREAGSGILELTLEPALDRHERIEVAATVDPVQAGALTPNQVSGATLKDIRKPETVADALPLIPGVTRTPAGDLEISGTGEHRSALIVNSADVTDPATGQFGLTVPIDSVESLSVFQTPFLAEYGRFTSGLVSVETHHGGDKWKWEINDPFPDFRIYSWHLRGVRDATPRLNLEGPLIKRKLYFSEGFEFEARNQEVYTLPYPANLTRKQGVNSFAQLDWVSSERNLVTATVHVAPQRLRYVNLDYFNPQPTTPDASTHNYTGTVADHLTLWGGLLENTFSMTRFGAKVWGQGDNEFFVTPGGNRGNYFADRSRDASRVAGLPTYTFPAFNHLGSHGFKIGSYIAESSNEGQLHESPINLLDQAGRLYERVVFTPGRPYEKSDREYAFFGQDHWSLSTRVAADLGIRTESQAVSRSFRVAPRAGIAWVPFANSGTVIRAGFGLFYDRVPLNVYCFDVYPKRLITYFDEFGEISGGPYLFGNALGVVNIHSRWVFHQHVPGDFSPRSGTGSLYLEQTVSQKLKLRVGYMENRAAGLVIMNPTGPDPDTHLGAYELSGDGDSRYKQLEVTARLRPSANHEVFLSYIRSRARGDINDFNRYLGSYPEPIIRPNQTGILPGDLPNRFLAWGLFKLPRGFQIAPIAEYRSGFPYSIFDARQDYVGVPNQQRYRNFLSIDSRFSKDIPVNGKYTVRLSLVTYNLSNHFNPNTLHANTADTAYGIFFGSRGRRYTMDFDVLF